MAKFVLKDAVVMFDGRDLSGELSSVELEYSQTTPEFTAFGDGAKRRLPGILNVNANQNGWWDAVSAADSLDADLFAKLAAASGLMSMSPDGGQIGEVGFSFKTQTAEYAPGASHGEVFAFALSVMGDDIMIRGSVMENAVFTSTANGTARQVGALVAGQTMFSTIHVVAASGTPTLDVTVESDATNSFSGGETVRMTHPQFTAVGANQQSVAGAITDSWWRLVLAIGGSSPSFTVFGVLGIFAGSSPTPPKNFLAHPAELAITTTIPAVA